MNENNTNTIMISREEYRTLIISAARLDAIRTIAEKDSFSYRNYDSSTSVMIDTLLGIERKENAV